MQKIIEKIHRKFDTAGEKLLAQAKEILATPIVNNSDKITRLNKIGFGTAKPIKDLEEVTKKKTEAQETIEAIEYYQTYYPSYKFISKSQIEKICKKYGLLFGESKNYLGDIPDKNLAEIEAFKLREEDYYEEISWSSMFENFGMFMPIRSVLPRQWFWYENNQSSQLVDKIEISNDTVTTQGLIPQIQASGNTAYYDATPKKTKPPFKICAPKKDFNTQGYEVKDGYKLVYDPIVIQPVKYKNIEGGLVISKWGLEGEDKDLVNEKLN